MNGFGKLFLAGACAALVSVSAHADSTGDMYWSALGTYVVTDDDRTTDDGLGIGGAYGWVISDGWNLEVAGGYDTADGDSSEFDLDQFYLGGNLLNVYRRGKEFQPFWMVGAGMVNSDADANGGSDQNVFTHIGAGALVPIGSGKVRLRGEVLSRWENDSDVYQDWFINLGVAVRVGDDSDPVPAAVVIVDSDGDGVPDNIDQCPGTPVGAVVDEVGCELDSDGDGVVDRLDQCPDTPPGVEVNAVGCERDSDGDGVVNSADECPDTPPNTPVDSFGCPFPVVMKLPEVTFRTNSVMLLDGADASLAAAAATLIQNPGMSVEVAGHTDSQGDASYNRDLSQRRAEAVREYLITAGVDENRITARGYGEDDPVADNNTAAGRAENRRVELRVQE